MADARYRLPSEVANQLEVSPSTLRRWSNEFADSLSDSAGRPGSASGSQAAHRRYTDEDLETLMTVKGLLSEGMSYVQVGKRLGALRLRRATSDQTDVDGADEPDQVRALGPSLRDSAAYGPAVTVLADTLHTVADGQQLLLGSQQANRDLLTVVLQDNFSLKEENAKLRDRMLDLERDMAEIRRQESARCDAFESRVQELETQIRQLRTKPPTAPESQRPGCLGQIFG